MTLNELTPEQIVFINTINEALLRTYEDVLRDKGITYETEIPMLGTMRAFRKLEQNELEEILNNERFNFAKTLREKFGPIVELIKEATPEIYNQAILLADVSRNDEAPLDQLS